VLYPASTNSKMSAQARPISPTRFASALRDLTLPSLYNKVSELRNQLAHLDYSNQEMRAFAEGTAPGLTEPDKECITAIQENEVVIQRILQRLALLRSEIERRGNAWVDVQAEEEGRLANGQTSPEGHDAVAAQPIVVNASASEGRSEAWRDGTFVTGRLVNGEVVMDSVDEIAARRDIEVNGATGGGGVISGSAANTLRTDEAIHEPHHHGELRSTEGDEIEDEGIHL
jgi:hypothetical protein